MKVGFLSIENRTVELRDASVALFDGGHSCGPLLTVSDTSEIDWALSQLRQSCDAIVIEGNVGAFYDVFNDRLSAKHPEYFELDGKLYFVAKKATAEYLNNKFVPIINSKNKKRFQVIVFKTYGKTEEELRAVLKEYTKSRSKIQLGFFPDFLECEVHVRGSASMSQVDYKAAVDKIGQTLYKCTYTLDRIGIAERVAQMLTEQKLKLKLAESFTGGAIAKELTSIAGASEYLAEGLVTYSVASKIKRLGVPAEAIAENGVVSSDTAYRMAVGLLASGDCDVAIATTGNAGPTSSTGPLGLCYIAIGNKNEVHTMRYTFDGDRNENIRRGVKNALFLLYRYLDSREAAELRQSGGQSDNV